MKFIDLSCEGMSHFSKDPKWPFFWHVPYFHINSCCCLWSSIEPTHSNWSLQSICLPLNVDLLQGCALLTLDRNTSGVTCCSFQSGAPFCCSRNHVIPVRSVSPPPPVAEHLFNSLSPVCSSLDRTMQTKWPSKWAAACQLWNKFSRSSLLPPRPLRFLVFLSSECHHQIKFFKLVTWTLSMGCT